MSAACANASSAAFVAAPAAAASGANTTPDAYSMANRTHESNIFLTGGWAPVHEEFLNVALESSKLPGDLRGVYTKNGPNPIHKPRTPHFHWFEGDGRVNMVQLPGPGGNGRTDGVVTFTARNMQTETFKHNSEYSKTHNGERANYSVFNDLRSGGAVFQMLAWKTAYQVMSVLNPIVDLRRMLFGMGADKNVCEIYGAKDLANTATVKHGAEGRHFALVETGPLLEFNVVSSSQQSDQDALKKNLATVGPETFNGSVGVDGRMPFSAHPKIDPATGDMYAVAYAAQLNPPIALTVVPADMSTKKPLALRHVGVNYGHCPVMHDFALSENYCIVFCHALVFDPKRVVKKGDSIFQFDESENVPTFIGVVHRKHLRRPVAPDPDALSDMLPLAPTKWFKTTRSVVFHHANAFEDKAGNLVLTAMRHHRIDMDLEKHNLRERHEHRHVGGAFTRWAMRLDTATETTLQPHTEEAAKCLGKVDELILSADHLGEFPVVNPKFVGRPHRFVWAGIHAFDGHATKPRMMEYPQPAGKAPIDNQFRVAGFAKFDLAGAPPPPADATSYSGDAKCNTASAADAKKVVTHEFRLAEEEEGDEFVFAPKHGASASASADAAEDDGYLVGYVYKGAMSGKSDFVVLNAHDLSVVCRVELPGRVPHGFHGYFAPA